MNTLKKILLFVLVTTSLNAQNLKTDLSLMPWPKEIKENSTKFKIDENLLITINGEDSGRVRNAAFSFLRRLTDRTGIFLNEGFPKFEDNSAQIQINFKSIAKLTINDDESYNLIVNNNKISINNKLMFYIVVKVFCFHNTSNNIMHCYT